MANWAQRIADRFKPKIGERLKQSAEAKKQTKDRHLGIVPKPKVVAPVQQHPRRILESQTTDVNVYGEVTTRQIWREWSQNGILRSTGSITGGTGDTWGAWNTMGTSSAIYDTNVWNAWTTGPRITIHQNINTATTWSSWVDESHNVRPQNMPRRNVEQERQYRAEEEARLARYRAEDEARNAKWREDERIRANKKKEADDRAMKLLVSMLDAQQRSDLKAYNYFLVEAPSGRLYRIDYGMHGNVKVIDRVTRKIIERLCIQPSGVPAADANLMQKLLIETSEEAFRAHANITLENGSVVYGRREPLDDAALDNVIPIRRAA